MELSTTDQKSLSRSGVCTVKGIKKQISRCPEFVYINAKDVKLLIVFFTACLCFVCLFITHEANKALPLDLRNKTSCGWRNQTL